MDEQMATRPAVQLAAAIRARELSSRELLELYLDRIERLEPRRSTRWSRSTPSGRAPRPTPPTPARRAATQLGPLHGLPITIKDAIETEGIRSTGGAVELTDHVPAHDAPAVARLKAAGAIVFGKTNVPRWSGDFQTFNEIFGGHQQPVGPRPHRRRIVGRRRGRGRRRLHQLRARDRHRRFGAHPVALLRRVRAEAELRRDPAARLPRPRRRWHHRRRHQRVRSDRPQRRRSRSAARRARRSGARTRRRLATRASAVRRAHRSATSASAPGSTIRRRPSTREYGALLRAAVDALADAGAKVDDERSAASTSREQRDLFSRMILPAISPSLPDDQADALSGSHRAWLRAEEERAALRRTWAEWFTGHDLLLLPGDDGARVPARPRARHARTAPSRSTARPRALIEHHRLAGADRRRGLAVGGRPHRPHGRRAPGRDADRRAVPPRPPGGPGGPAGQRGPRRLHPAPGLLMWSH